MTFALLLISSVLALAVAASNLLAHALIRIWDAIR